MPLDHPLSRTSRAGRHRSAVASMQSRRARLAFYNCPVEVCRRVGLHRPYLYRAARSSQQQQEYPHHVNVKASTTSSSHSTNNSFASNITTTTTVSSSSGSKAGACKAGACKAHHRKHHHPSTPAPAFERGPSHHCAWRASPPLHSSLSAALPALSRGRWSSRGATCARHAHTLTPSLAPSVKDSTNDQ